MDGRQNKGSNNDEWRGNALLEVIPFHNVITWYSNLKSVKHFFNGQIYAPIMEKGNVIFFAKIISALNEPCQIET